jgi:putative FmdB family regulatory protein
VPEPDGGPARSREPFRARLTGAFWWRSCWAASWAGRPATRWAWNVRPFAAVGFLGSFRSCWGFWWAARTAGTGRDNRRRRFLRRLYDVLQVQLRVGPPARERTGGNVRSDEGLGPSRPGLDTWIYKTSRLKRRNGFWRTLIGARRTHSGWPASTGIRRLLMATYEYLCSRCGPFDVKLAIGTAPRNYGCPVCTGAARRVYSSPGLTLTSHAVAALHGREEQAREAPAVVSEVPPRKRVPRHPHPALSRLPRP